MLKTTALAKNVGTTPILRGVELTLRPGVITGILSLEKIETRVLLSLLAGQEEPLSGTIEREHDTVELIPGTSRLFGNLSILDNLAVGVLGQGARGIVPLDAIIQRVQPYITDFGLERSLETRMNDLRIPEQQLVSLILFLLQQTDVILLRDVLTNLSLDQYKLFVWKVKELAASGKAIGIVPDNPNQLFDFCNEVVLLRGGKTIYNGPIDEIDLEEVHNVLNNTEYMIQQSLENKFHSFQNNISEIDILFERSLKVVANFCGQSRGLIVWGDPDHELEIAFANSWKTDRPTKAQVRKVHDAACKEGSADGEVSIDGHTYAWTALQPGECNGALLVLAGKADREFPFPAVIDLLRQTVDFLADRLKKEAEARERELQSVRLGREMDIARNIQASILPKKVGLPGFTLASHCETATEVGGDSWDLVHTPMGNFLSVGDVSGHGLPSGIMALIEMAALHGVIQSQSLAGTKTDPAQVYDMVNRVLCEINRDRIGSDKFMTKILLVENKGEFHHAGTHEIGLLYSKKTGQITELDHMVDKTGFLGLSEYVDSRLSLGRFTMEQGDLLLLYTDGLIEAKDAHDEQYGIDRVKASLLKDVNRTPDQMLTDLRADLFTFAEHGDRKKHGGRLADDLTMVMLRRDTSLGA